MRNRLLTWWQKQQPATLGVFWPIRGEPDLRPAYGELATLGVRLALPAVREREAPLAFLEWKPGDPMAKDPFGVPVPRAGSPVAPDAVLIPCVGFNARCFRLGYGGGMFDRTLAVMPRPIAIGVGYGCGLVEFEVDAHDIALDAVLTESALLTPT